MKEEPSFLFSVADAIDAADLKQTEALFRQHPEQLEVFTPFAGGTWLHYAARESSLDMVSLLVDIGFDVNVGDRWEGASPLTRAAVGGKYDIVEYLLDKGAALDVSTAARNPLFSAVRGHSPRIVKLLLDRGIDCKTRYNTETMREMDALAFASMWGETDIVNIIAEHLAHGDLKMKHALMKAARETAESHVEPDPHASTCPDLSEENDVTRH